MPAFLGLWSHNIFMMLASEKEAMSLCCWTKCDRRINSAASKRKMRVRGRKRRVWVHDWLTEKSRQSFGYYAILVNQLREKDTPAFKNFTRMDLMVCCFGLFFLDSMVRCTLQQANCNVTHSVLYINVPNIHLIRE